MERLREGLGLWGLLCVARRSYLSAGGRRSSISVIAPPLCAGPRSLGLPPQILSAAPSKHPSERMGRSQPSRLASKASAEVSVREAAQTRRSQMDR